MCNTLLDPELVEEADGVDDQKKVLKSLCFPVMDDPDALPSSFIPKVLQAMAKWSCKMDSLAEFFTENPGSASDPFLYSKHFLDHHLKSVAFFIVAEQVW